MRSPTSRILTRHFLRRFFENDLVSAHIDLHENMTTAAAAVVSLSLFFSFIVGSSYLFGHPPPGVIAVTSVGQNFMFLHVAMCGLALAAALQWDALSLDVRDIANLGPLPIPRRSLVIAKLTALAIFVAGFAAALTVFPSVLFESFVVYQLPVRVIDMLWLDICHLIASILACAFGFLAVVAIREVLRLVLGSTGFSRVSAFVQGMLVLASTSGLLLTPALVERMGDWMRTGMPSPWLLPSLAFSGFEQRLAGGVIVNVTGVVVAPRMRPANEGALAAYHALEPYFRECQSVAIALAAGALVIASLAYGWNLRHAPQPLSSSKRRRTGVALVSGLLSGRDSMRRAGLSFALQAIVRSGPHRLSMAGAAALAIALSFMFLSGAGFKPAANPWFPPILILAVQTMAVTIMLAAFRRAVRVPAELRANWILQLTWRPGERRFLTGVKLAALAGVALPTLMVLGPLHLWLLSPAVAAVHFLIGLAYSVAVNEVLFNRCRKVPFAASFEPMSNVKTLGPIVLLLFLLFVNTFTRIERLALQSGEGITHLVLVLLAVAAVLRALDYWTTEPPLQFDEPPEPATQWLGLTQ